MLNHDLDARHAARRGAFASGVLKALDAVLATPLDDPRLVQLQAILTRAQADHLAEEVDRLQRLQAELTASAARCEALLAETRRAA